MIIKSNNKIYYKSKFPDIIIPEESAPKVILNHLRSRENHCVFVDGISTREYGSHYIADTIEKVASGFHKLGLRKKDIVGFILPNLPEYSTLFHGTLLIGGVASLVNPEYTIHEYEHTLGTVKPKFIVTFPTVYDKIKDDIKRVFPLVEKVILCGVPYNNVEAIHKAEKENPNLVMSYDSLINNDGKYPNIPIDSKKDMAVIPFSSGTTGLFKGVCLSHYNILSNTYQTQVIETSNYRKNDTVMGILPFFHIYGLMLFLMLMLKQGYRVVTLPKFEPIRFLQLIEKYSVSISFIVPPVALLFAKSPLVDKFDLSALRVLFSGAAPLSENIEAEIKQRFKDKVIIKQGYGLSEISPACCVAPYGDNKSGSVGVLLPNQIAKIIDTMTGETLNAGAKGEICIKGPNVMLGYFDNPKATAEVIDNEGFLRTGDIGYVDDDGFFYVVDRQKELIKVKGFQVAPAELEALLLTHPKIQDACVVGLPRGEVGEVPRGFVVLKPGQAATEKEILDWAHPKIANYKHFRGGLFFLQAVPKSATGKLLRKELKNFTPPKL
ncbi:hypothetical protein DICPUDRAFT_36508 [Dictyostelium purpureum]|uniref:4-coumarate-CoA ligase n=1 Tax=Dictyostelium purpureum TaxID=5786 RepID=F0ZR52_DICPU|nr:uncharacterized protein DICPUDRAFT_36508 [Dictyostelium purpureum]EGC33576.1 hypothetical protein DICPUDRAFT_36508 [Dictyostelium purpureum]|eukprot:XP_003289891.1 hypothetical protein DICPUDRAFT_36508 [Dictyostelium purpureum]